MKILFFSPYYFPYTSGVTTYPQKILSDLSNKNEIEVLTFKYNKNLKTEENVNNYKITRINYWFKISKGFISPQSIFYFLNKINKCDLVILNQPNFEGLFLALIAKAFKKKIFSIFHCQVFLSFNFINMIINYFLNLSIKIQLSLSNKIVGYTEDYFNSIPSLREFKKKTVFVLPPIENNPPDRKLLKKLLGKKRTDIWIGYAGRISEEKGIEYLIESMNIICRDKALPCPVLILAGPYGKDVAGESNYYDKIIALLKKNKISYLFLGNLAKNQLFSFYKSIDILVLPSTNQTEAFGMVQAEAMISGTPVIASNLPGVRVPVQLTKMGKLIEPKNPKQLAEAILEILKNKDRFSNDKLIKNAQNIFDINKFYKFYDTLLSSRAESRGLSLDYFIESYLENRPMFLAIIRSQEAMLFQHFQKYIKNKTLDFGCGDGFFAETVFGKNLPAGRQVKINVGLDLFNNKRVEESKNKNIYEKIIFYDGLNIPFKNNYFKSVVSNCVLEHIPEVNQSIHEIYRVLKPKGYFITSVMTNNWNKYLAGKKIFGKFYVDYLKKTQVHLNLFSYQEWIKLFKKAGFQIIDIRGYLSEKNSLFMDLAHYLSIPSLISYLLLNNWQIFPKITSRLWKRFITNNIELNVDPKKSSALFFVLKK